MSMASLHYAAPTADGAAAGLLVLLPGAGMAAGDFATHGLISAVHRRRWSVDIVAVDTGMETYLDGDIAERLRDEVIAPLRADGARLWLAGVSLGGFGALRYLQAYDEEVAGLLLLAPFIGSRGLIAAVEACGGLRAWSRRAPSDVTPQHRLLKWLAEREFGDARCPTVQLGFGTGDRFAAAHHLLAALLPVARVEMLGGGHDWPTWEALWERMLDGALHDLSGERQVSR